MQYKGAIFDMDGTLVDSLSVWDVLWAEYGNRYCGGKAFSPTDEDDKKIRTLPLKEAMELVHDNYGLGENVTELLELANETLLNFYKNVVKLKKGAKELLEYLKSNNVKMCIASATDPELISVAMAECDLNKYFEGVLSCAVIGKGKDTPDIYMEALKFLGTDISDTVLFEDSVVAIETGVKFGLDTVGIYDKYNPSQERIKEIADLYVDADDDLTKFVKLNGCLK